MQLLAEFCFVLFWPRIILFRSGEWVGWVGGWLEKVKIKINQLSTKFKVKLKLKLDNVPKSRKSS